MDTDDLQDVTQYAGVDLRAENDALQYTNTGVVHHNVLKAQRVVDMSALKPKLPPCSSAVPILVALAVTERLRAIIEKALETSKARLELDLDEFPDIAITTNTLKQISFLKRQESGQQEAIVPKASGAAVDAFKAKLTNSTAIAAAGGGQMRSWMTADAQKPSSGLTNTKKKDHTISTAKGFLEGSARVKAKRDRKIEARDVRFVLRREGRMKSNPNIW